MASYLQIENISKSYGTEVLFEHIGFNVNEGDKIALIAPNGAGKTSLLRIIAGYDSSDSGGRILFLKDIRIAYLEQDYDFNPDLGIMDQILSHSDLHSSDFHLQRHPGYEQRVREFLSNFKLNDPQKRMGDLSGGEVKRVAISEMLAEEADFLIMDEPTNHLDVDAIEYLEGFLKRSRCTLLMVTHDRYFLDRVCNTVMELDHGAIYIYKGDYQNYLEQRESRIASYNAETDKVRNILRRELEWIHATPCARSGKAKYRIDAFQNLSERASQAYSTKQISLDGVGGSTRLGNKIIDCKKVSYFWEKECLLRDFSYSFQKSDKIGIVGRNGCGKTTFLDLLTGSAAPSSGTIERGDSIKIGYYRQSGIDLGDMDRTVLEVVSDTRLLNMFLFSHDMLSTRVSRLSGGERRRLYLLTILMQNPNLLILDEPTNDLDVLTLDVLEEYLKEFSGSLLIVSHDRHFLDRVADHLLVFCGDGVIKDFLGTFSEYRAFAKDYEAQHKAASAPRPVQVPAAPKEKKPGRLSFKEQRELESVEARLKEIEDERGKLETEMSSGKMDYTGLQSASSHMQELISETDRLETRWLELSDGL